MYTLKDLEKHKNTVKLKLQLENWEEKLRAIAGVFDPPLVFKKVTNPYEQLIGFKRKEKDYIIYSNSATIPLILEYYRPYLPELTEEMLIKIIQKGE